MSWQGYDQTAQRQQVPTRTFEVPLRIFPEEITIPANTRQSIPLPQTCAQIAFINVVPGVWASFNGGGARTIKDGFVYNGEFQSLEVLTDATGSATIQLGAY
jgi:hypothetical protein